MGQPQIRYDEESDTLQFAFVPNRSATGLELNENILLRVDTHARQAVGLTIFNFSVLAQPTEMGPRRVPLTGLAELNPDARELALEVLRTPPVADYLRLSAYMPSGSAGDVIPITSVQAVPPAPQAA